MASKRGRAAKSRARSRRGRGGGSSKLTGAPSAGGASWWLVGAIITFGGVILGKLCKLPVWLSPIGAALWLFGWWKSNAYLRALGLLYIGTGLAAVMGMPQALSTAIDNAKKSGALGGLFNFIPSSFDMGGGGTPQGNGGGGGRGFDLANTIEVAADLTRALQPIFA